MAAKKEERTKKGSMFRTKAFRAGGYSTAAAAIVIVIAVVINLLVSAISTAYTNVDTTESGLYSVSKQTKELIASLEDEVTVYYIASADARTAYVSKLLDRFSACGSKLKVENIDPDVNPNFAADYTDETVADGDLLVVCGEKAQVVHAEDMIEYEAGSYEYYYYYLQYYGQQTDVYWNGEVKLVKAIDYVVTTQTYHVYFLDANGDGEYSALEEALDNENIEYAALTEESDIPDNASCVVLTGLSEDISETVAGRLRDYLADGGKLYIAVDISDSERPVLDELLSDYGIQFTEAAVYDGDRNYGSESELYPQYTGDHAIIAPFSKANYLYFSNAMGILYEEQDGVTVTPLIATSSSAYLSTDASDALSFASYPLGVAVDDAETNAQLVVFGSASYTDSTYMSDTSLANSDLFVNAVGYLCDKESAITVHAKAVTSDTTLDLSGSSTGFIAVMIAAVPALIAIVAGFMIWYRRKNS